MAAKSNDEKAPVAKTEPTVHVPSESSRVAKLDAVKPPDLREPAADVQLMNGPVETASTKLADGFDFPVGKPHADGYYRARGFRSGGHMGEDWDGVRGGGKRVWKYFPIVHVWKLKVTVYILDDTITKDVFERHFKEAGRFIGVGFYRPQRGGTNGRFAPTHFDWQEEK